MLQRIYRIVFLLFVVAGSLRLSAQTAPANDIGIWIVGSQLAESSVVDDGDELRFDFDEDLGYGISFNHFWTNAFSTEIAAQKFGADLILSTPPGPGSFEFNAGEVDVTAITAMAQWHFRRGTRFAPYIGGGIARISGEFDPTDIPDEPETNGSIDLDAEFAWTAAIGANVNLTDRLSLVGELKYIPWSALADGDMNEDRLDVDPLTFAAGVKLRF